MRNAKCGWDEGTQSCSNTEDPAIGKRLDVCPASQCQSPPAQLSCSKSGKCPSEYNADCACQNGRQWKFVCVAETCQCNCVGEC